VSAQQRDWDQLVRVLTPIEREKLRARLDECERDARRAVFGAPGVRDPEHPCDEFDPGEPDGHCGTDGHYMCTECRHADLCERCNESEMRCECEVKP
jgi:hypothetical protein